MELRVHWAANEQISSEWFGLTSIRRRITATTIECSAATKSPLASALCGIAGVARIMTDPDGITVEFGKPVPLSSIKPINREIVEIFDREILRNRGKFLLYTIYR